MSVILKLIQEKALGSKTTGLKIPFRDLTTPKLLHLPKCCSCFDSSTT